LLIGSVSASFNAGGNVDIVLCLHATRILI